MTSRIAELQYKEVVDITDGTRYGYIGDLEIDTEHGTIESIIIYGRPRLWGLLGREPDAVFPWTSIKRIGSDLILVERQTIESPHHHK